MTSPSQYSIISLLGVVPEKIRKIVFNALTSHVSGISLIHSMPLFFFLQLKFFPVTASKITDCFQALYSSIDFFDSSIIESICAHFSSRKFAILVCSDFEGGYIINVFKKSSILKSHCPTRRPVDNLSNSWAYILLRRR